MDGNNNEEHWSERWTAEKLSQASYKDLGSPSEVEERFYHHMLSNETCRQSMQDLLAENSTTTRDYSIAVDAFDLLQADPILGQMLLRFPVTLLPLLVNAIVRGQIDLLSKLPPPPPSDGSELESTHSVKGLKADGVATAATRVHARLVNLPPFCCKTSLASMQASDVGKILQVSGIVVRTGPVQMYESTRTYKCIGKHGCQRHFVVHADLEQRDNALQPPKHCPLLVEGGSRCPGNKLQSVEGGSVHTDYQEIKIQDAASNLEIGHIPRSLLIKLQHDLVDRCQPGDEVVVVGLLLAQWQQSSPQPDIECHVGVAMSAHSVRVVAENGSAWQDSNGQTNAVGQMDQYRKEFIAFWDDESNRKNPIAARDFISQAVCPKLYGMKVIKLALLITLIGGISSDVYGNTQSQPDPEGDQQAIQCDGPVPFRISTKGPEARSHNDEFYEHGVRTTGTYQTAKNNRGEHVHTRRRDQSHLLLVGDPGTGKSQFLRFAAALCPRSVLTTGVGTTSAGLTCAAVREGNGKEFALEAGALVLADKGVCCIDEFGCIRDQDRTTIHEAMEQQTLSVAKAGIVCKLNCRATIIAVMNPRNSIYDNQATLSVNTGLGTPLLSRFDLIFKLIDTSDAERDSNVTTYLLNRAIQGAGFDVIEAADTESKIPWNLEKLRAYVSIVKERFQPAMSDAAATLLERHYERCRGVNSTTIPITVRFLESLIRLSQAHARVMFRNIVTLDDAVAVLEIMQSSAFACGGFDGFNHSATLHYSDPMSIDYSTEADIDFLCHKYHTLKTYNMLNFMDDQSQRKAIGMLNDTGRLESSGWNDLDARFSSAANFEGTTLTQDHYGRSYFDPPSQKRSRRIQ